MIYIRKHDTGGRREIYTIRRSQLGIRPDVSQLLLLTPPKTTDSERLYPLESKDNRISMLNVLRLWFRIQFGIHPLERGLERHIEKTYPDVEWKF